MWLRLTLGLALAWQAVIAVPGGAAAAPIAYEFQGEMTSFTPPVSDPGPPPPVPIELRFFSGAFIYDPASTTPVTGFGVVFAGGPELVVVPATQTFVEARIFEERFLFDLAFRGISIGGGFPDSSIAFQFERPLAPGDVAGVLPPDLDGFVGSFAAATFLGQFFVRGSVLELDRAITAIPEPSLALLLLAALLAFRRRDARA